MFLNDYDENQFYFTILPISKIVNGKLTVVMTQLNNCVVGILRHAIASSKSSFQGRHQFSSGSILVFKVAVVALTWRESVDVDHVIEKIQMGVVLTVNEICKGLFRLKNSWKDFL